MSESKPVESTTGYAKISFYDEFSNQTEKAIIRVASELPGYTRKASI